MKIRKILAASAVAVMLGTTLAACGSGETETIRPASYGSDVTDQCYFIEDADEVRLLKEDGLCEDDWVATPAPEDYVASYYPFFFFVGGSGGHHYRDYYVPKQKRGSYVSKFQGYEKNPVFKQKVNTLSPKAQYKTSTGKTIVGSKIKGSTFGGGSRVKAGSGSRTKVCSLGPVGMDTLLAKGGGGSRGGSSGGSRSSGGGSKSGGSKGTTKSGSKPKGGC